MISPSWGWGVDGTSGYKRSEIKIVVFHLMDFEARDIQGR